MFDLPTILKPNATTHDRALEQAIRKGKPDLMPITTLMNPDTCPVHLLGWLAWSLSVDVWEPDWSENTKRSVLKGSLEVHRKKGTVGSVRRALEWIGFEADIREWFEVDGVEIAGAPGTFEVTTIFPEEADLGGDGLARSIDAAKRVIDATKPVSAHYGFHIGQKITGANRLGASAFGRMADTREPRIEATAQATRYPSAALIGHIRNTASTVAMRMTRGPVVAVFGKLEVV